MLYADRHRKSLEETVNKELKNVCEWLHVNKLTLNIKKSNFVIFRPPQVEIKLKVIDNSTNISSSLECKEYVKYLGVLIDNHLSWKYHTDYIAVKISKIVGVISRLRHLAPFCTLRCIYQSLILPYLTYGPWGQAAKAHPNRLFLLQKRALLLMYFFKSKNSCYSFFISSKILPIHLLYFEAVLHSMYDVSNNSAPKDISEKFVKTSLIHSYNTRAASCGKYHIQFLRLIQQRNPFSCFGMARKRGIVFNRKYVIYQNRTLSHIAETKDFARPTSHPVRGWTGKKKAFCSPGTQNGRRVIKVYWRSRNQFAKLYSRL